MDLVALDVGYRDDHHIEAMVLDVLGVQVVVDCLVAVLDDHLGVVLVYTLVEVLKALVVVCMKVVS